MKNFKLLLACLMIVVLLVGCSQSIPNEVSTIDAIGSGSIKADPDKAEVRITVETEGPTEEVQSENALKTDKVINAILELGISKDDIETQDIDFTPIYKYKDGQRENIGFRASNTIVVNTEKTEIVGKITDTAVETGATRTGGVSFILSEEGREKLLDQAIEKAVADAKRQAELAANAAGVKIKGIKNITVIKENGNQYRGPVYFDSIVAKEAAVDTPVLPAEQEVVVTVNASFIIE